jgi:hypothetical protein
MNQPTVIKSTSYDQYEIMESIIKLHCPNGIEVDTTYSIGNFYKNGRIPQPKYKFDKFPQREDIQQLEERLPFEDNTINSIMFDPPFVITGNKNVHNYDKGSTIIAKRFESFKNPKELFEVYSQALTEYYRVLDTNGVLIFKCQDTVSGGKNYFTHCWVMNKAYELGFYPKDLFILNAKNRIISSKHKNQQHSRKYHSYFWVFTKQKPKIKYEEL